MQVFDGSKLTLNGNDLAGIWELAYNRDDSLMNGIYYRERGYSFLASKLKITPLGGVSEIGKNLTVIEYGKDLVVVDCGSIFPTEEMPGIDLVIPDMTYLENNASRIRAFLITHGHEDHIGALPYALKKFPDVPIYGSQLTLALIENKFEEHKIKSAKLNRVNAGDKVRLGCMEIEFIHVNHSIAGAFALAIRTPIGAIIHTGDFKVDYSPIEGETPINLARFAEYGNEGVLALLCDSTNAEVPGQTMSESMVGETFEHYFEQATGRIIVATFASNIHRVQQICDAAVAHGRKVCIQGRSMINVTDIGKRLGYLHIEEKHLIDIDKLKNYPDDRICVITTGSQGEPMSGLSRMANNNHRLNIEKGDMVIMSASQIPGNERTISQVINKLFKKGAVVVYESMADVHVSGHARQEELKLIHTLTKPKFFIPVHGEYRHLMHHVMIAEQLGMPAKNIFVTDIGNTVEITAKSAKISNTVVPNGSVMVDGLGIGDIGNIVLRDRKLLSEDGLFVCVVTLEKKTGKLLAGPDIISRGFVYVRESEDLIDEARELARRIVLDFENKPYSDWAQIKNSMKNALRDYLYSRTKRNPMILPIVVEV